MSLCLSLTVLVLVLQPWVEKEKTNNDSYIQKRLEMGNACTATPSKRKRASETKGYRRAFQFFVNVSVFLFLVQLSGL